MGFLLANSKADTYTDWVFYVCIGALRTKSREKYRYRLGNLYLYRCSGRREQRKLPIQTGFFYLHRCSSCREQRKLPIQTGYFMFASVFFVPRARKNTVHFDQYYIPCPAREMCAGWYERLSSNGQNLHQTGYKE